MSAEKTTSASSESIDVVFYNVTITVADAETARAAYDKLCEVLAAAGFDFWTDTYTVLPQWGGETEARDTTELWPTEEN